jgi:hypothetical protein
MDRFVDVRVGQGTRVYELVGKLVDEDGQPHALLHADRPAPLPEKVPLIESGLAPRYQFPRGVTPHHFVHDGIIPVP